MRNWILLTGLITLTSLASPAMAQPSGTHGDPKKGITGLGQAAPDTVDVSVDASWSVYEFERDAIDYLQVNGYDGSVRATIGYIGNTFWVLPAGDDPVSTPQSPKPVPANATQKVVYRSPEIELAVYENSNGLLWVVRKP